MSAGAPTDRGGTSPTPTLDALVVEARTVGAARLREAGALALGVIGITIDAVASRSPAAGSAVASMRDVMTKVAARAEVTREMLVAAATPDAPDPIVEEEDAAPLTTGPRGSGSATGPR